jgi:hypothetical protein
MQDNEADRDPPLDVPTLGSSATTANDLNVKEHFGTPSIEGAKGDIEGARDCDPTAAPNAPNIGLPGSLVVVNAPIVEGEMQDEPGVPCEPQPESPDTSPRAHTEAGNVQIGT